MMTEMRSIEIAIAAAFIVIATIILSGLVDAKMPQTGDYVRATSVSSLGLLSVDGVVTDIGNGFICLNSSHAEVKTGENGLPITLWTTPRDVCIGIGTIIQLLWLDDSGNPIVQTEASLSIKECIKQPEGSPSVLVPNILPQPENDSGIKWVSVH
jgi:hypothetical protein